MRRNLHISRDLPAGERIDIGKVDSDGGVALHRVLRYAMREAAAQNRFMTVKHIQAAIESLPARAFSCTQSRALAIEQLCAFLPLLGL